MAENHHVGPPWAMLATLLLVVLKTTGVAEMSWLLAFSPILVTLAFVVVALVLATVIATFRG